MDTDIINTEVFHSHQNDFIIRILVAIGIGLVIGLEREHKQSIKTPLLQASVLLFLCTAWVCWRHALLSADTFCFTAVLAAVILLTGISYLVTPSKGDIGTTTEFALLISSFLLAPYRFSE